MEIRREDMMSHEITFLPDEPICIVTFREGWDAPESIRSRAQDFRRIFETANEPLHLIVDFTHVKMTLDGMLRSANSFARGPDAVFRHPMRKTLILVSTEKLAQMVARGLQSETFGHLHVHIFATLEEALAYARSQ